MTSITWSGVHVTQLFSFASGDPTEFASTSEEDAAAMRFLEEFSASGWLAYNQFQSAQPQTLALRAPGHAGGLACLVGQMFREWVDRDYILANASGATG